MINNLLAIQITRLKGSKLFKDSFWAVFGNGIGSGLMLLAGICIARFLGKDVYGEYGVVKSTMFYVAAFATLGLGFTSTKYVAEYVVRFPQYVKCIIRDSIFITLCTSALLAVLLIVFAHPLAHYLNEPGLGLAFQALGCIIIFRAWVTTQMGVLAGLKDFKGAARNNFWSGLFMLALAVPLTYWWGLKGALAALLLSQIFNTIINQLLLKKSLKNLPQQEEQSFKKELFLFSFPIALQESSYSVRNWLGMLILVKFSSTGELGLFTAASQWVAITMFIPGMLYNVVLSHLSTDSDNHQGQQRTMKIMLLTNLVSTLIPFLVIYFLASFISTFYGPTFTGLTPVLQVFMFSTIFDCCGNVYRAEFTALGRNWLMFTMRFIRDILFLVAGYLLITADHGVHGAYTWAVLTLWCGAIYFIALAGAYYITAHKVKTKKSAH